MDGVDRRERETGREVERETGRERESRDGIPSNEIKSIKCKKNMKDIDGLCNFNSMHMARIRMNMKGTWR